MSVRRAVIVASVVATSSACVDVGRSAPWPELEGDLSFLVVGDTSRFDVAGRFWGPLGPHVHSDPGVGATYLVNIATDGLADYSAVPDALQSAQLQLVESNAPACEDGRRDEAGLTIGIGLAERGQVFRLEGDGFTSVSLDTEPWNRAELLLPTQPSGCSPPRTLEPFAAQLDVLEEDLLIRRAFLVEPDRAIIITSSEIWNIERGAVISGAPEQRVSATILTGDQRTPNVVSGRAYLEPGEFVTLAGVGGAAYVSHLRATSAGIELIATSSRAAPTRPDEFAFDEHGRIVVTYGPADNEPLEVVLTTDAPGQALVEHATPGLRFRELQFTGAGSEFAFAGTASNDTIGLANFFDGPIEAIDVSPEGGFKGAGIGVVERPEGNMVWVAIDAVVEHPLLRRSPSRQSEWSTVPLRVPPIARECADFQDTCGHWRDRQMNQLANLTPGRALMIPRRCGYAFIVDPASVCEAQLVVTGDSELPVALDWRDDQVLLLSGGGGLYEASVR